MQVIYSVASLVKRTDRKSHCPVNVALESVGDPWSLLVVRDIVFFGKHTFGEFLASDERITTSVLSDRLVTLVDTGILTRQRGSADRRTAAYSLTPKGLALIPILVELANWGVAYDPEVNRNQMWIEAVRTDREGLYRLIREITAAGGSVFRGENCVIDRLSTSA